MSAELYDAEMSGALARPAVDVLPVHTSRKDKSGDVLPGIPLEPEPAAEGDPGIDAAVPALEPEAPATELVAELPTLAVDEPEAAPRKVFGLSLTRGRRAKPAPVEEVQDPSSEVAEGEALPEAAAVPVVADPSVVADAAPAEAIWDFQAEPAPVVAAPAAADPSADHGEETRALKALLETSENLRQEAEARTAAAEAAVRTATNAAQEWQIRHREAEATISELAGSLAGAEGRMAELHQQLQALQAERDELVTQLDAATSPTA